MPAARQRRDGRARQARADQARPLTALACGGHVLLEDVPGTAKTVLARALARSIEGAHVSRDPVHARPPADRRHRPLDLQPARAASSSSAPARSSPTSCSSTRSTARCRRRSRRCSRRWPSGRSRSTASPARCRRRSSCSRPRTRSSRRARSRCPRPSSTASSCAPRSAIPTEDEELGSCEDQRAGHPLDALGRCVALAEVRALQARSTTSTSTRSSQRWIVELVRATRELEFVALGASVRGSLALERATRAWALVHGRDYAEPEDVEQLFGPWSRTACCFAGSSPSARRGADEAAAGLAPLPRARAAAGARLGSTSPSALAGASDDRRLAFPLIPRRRLVGLRSAAAQLAPRARVRRRRLAAVPARRPVARIDWAASARLSAARGSDEFIVREHFAEEAPRVVVVPTGARRWGSTRRRSWLDKPRPLLRALDRSCERARRARPDRLRRPGGRRRSGGRRVRAARWSRAVDRGVRRAGRARLARARAPHAHRRDVPPQLRLRRLGLPRRTRAGGLARAPARRWELVPVVVQDPVWEQSFPGRRRARPVRRRGDPARRPRLPHARRRPTG